MKNKSGNKLTRYSSSVFFLATSYLSIVLVVIQGIVLVPLYLQQISSELYGGWLASGNLIAYLSFFDFGLSTVINQQVSQAYGAQDRAKVSRIAGTGILIGALLSLLLILTGVVFSNLVPFWVKVPAKDIAVLKLAVALASVSTGITTFTYFLASITLALQRSLALGIINIISWCISILLIFVGLTLGLGLISIPVGYLIRSVFYLGAVLFHLSKLWKTEVQERIVFDRDELKRLGGLSSFVFLSKIGTTLISQSDAFVIAAILGPGQTTIFSLTSRAKDAIQAIPDRISSSVSPGIAHLMGEGNVSRVKQVSLDVLSISIGLTLLCGSAVIGLNYSFVKLWVGNEFYGGKEITVGIVFYFILTIYKNALTNLLTAIGEMKKPGVLSLIEAIAKIILIIILTQKFGLLGAVMGSILSILLTSTYFLTRLYLRKFSIHTESIKEKRKALFLYPVISINIGFFWMLIAPSETWQNFFLQAVCLGGILFCFLWLLNKDVRKHVKEAAVRLLSPLLAYTASRH